MYWSASATLRISDSCEIVVRVMEELFVGRPARSLETAILASPACCAGLLVDAADVDTRP
jgi:hypothetical protein